jgi:Nitroreductase family
MPLIAEHEALRVLCSPGRSEAPRPAVSAGPSALSSPEVCPVPGQTLAGRRSVRQFAGRPVPVALLADACHNAVRAEHASWPAEAHGDAGLKIVVAAAQVDGLAKGAHAFSIATDGFDYLAGPALIDELRLHYAKAPAFVLVCADRARDVLPQSTYQSMLVRAGSLGYAAWLNAMAAGLCGCPFGRAISEAPIALSAGYGRPVHHLFTIALGWPAEAEPPRESVG